MSLIAKQTGEDFEIAPAGNYAARCYQMVELGIREKGGMYPGEAHQMRWAFEIDERMRDGRPFSVSEILTISLSSKAKLRDRLKSWRGRDFTEAELAGFDLKNVVGAPCLINVVHNESGGKTYANIASITPLPKGMAAPELQNDKLVWEFGDDESLLPEWIRKMLGRDPREATYKESLVPADDYDDVPF